MLDAIACFALLWFAVLCIREDRPTLRFPAGIAAAIFLLGAITVAALHFADH